MLSEAKKEDKLIVALKAYQQKFKRTPSLRELGEQLAWKKSLVTKYVNRMLKSGRLGADFENGRVVSKSLRVV